MIHGLHDKVPMDEYLELVAVSSGVLHTALTVSPFHGWFCSPWNPERPAVEGKEIDIGTLAHAYLLEGGAGKICVINPEDYRSKPTKNNPEGNIPNGWTNNAIRDARDLARANGLVPMLPWDMAAVRVMVDAAKAFISKSEIAGAMDFGAPEQTCVAELDGLLCKARPDWLNLGESIHLQYKTCTGTAEPEGWIRSQLFAQGHDMAAAYYERVIAAATGKQVRTVFLVQSQSAPHACSLVALSPMAQDLAERKVSRALKLWAACQKANRWPSFPRQIAYADPPAWEVAKEEERENDPYEFANSEVLPA